MKDFFASLQPQLTQTMAEEFELLLEAVDGQTPRAGAIATADGLAWRLDLDTDEALAARIARYQVLYREQLGREFTDKNARTQRWWPDEWDAVPVDPALGIPNIASPIGAVQRQVAQYFAEHQDDHDDFWDEFIAEVSAFLARSLGSDEVRAVWAKRGVTPFLVVNETDGDLTPAVAAFELLNQAHPDQAGYRDGLAFWQERAA